LGEVLVILVVALGFVAIGPILAIVAIVRGERLKKRVQELETSLNLFQAAGPAPAPRPVHAT